MIPIARPQMGEEEKERVWEAMSSGSLAQGPRVKQLEDEFAAFVGADHAVATSSGTTALHLAMMALECIWDQTRPYELLAQDLAAFDGSIDADFAFASGRLGEG